MSWVLDESQAMGSDYTVMLIMAHHTDDFGFVSLSKATLAEECRLSQDTVMRAQQRNLVLGEIAPVDIGDAPDWWLAIPKNRRPKLFTMIAFLGSHYATPVRRRRGVARGSRGGSAGVDATPSDQGLRDAKSEQRTVKTTRSADSSCIQCRGTGVVYSGAGFDRPCPCVDERPMVPVDL